MGDTSVSKTASSAGPSVAFAVELRALAKSAKVTYRMLTDQFGYPATTLSDWFNGKRLPSLEVVLNIVAACGGKANDWTAEWRKVKGLIDAQANEKRVAPGGAKLDIGALVAEVLDRHEGPLSGAVIEVTVRIHLP